MQEEKNWWTCEKACRGAELWCGGGIAGAGRPWIRARNLVMRPVDSAIGLSRQGPSGCRGGVPGRAGCAWRMSECLPDRAL